MLLAEKWERCIRHCVFASNEAQLVASRGVFWLMHWIPSAMAMMDRPKLAIVGLQRRSITPAAINFAASASLITALAAPLLKTGPCGCPLSMLDSLNGALKETPSTMIIWAPLWISTVQAISSPPLWIDFLRQVNLILSVTSSQNNGC
jgi:hypothetical protein